MVWALYRPSIQLCMVGALCRPSSRVATCWEGALPSLHGPWVGLHVGREPSLHLPTAGLSLAAGGCRKVEPCHDHCHCHCQAARLLSPCSSSAWCNRTTGCGTLTTVYTTVYTQQCTLNSVHSRVHTKQCTLNSVHSTVYTQQCTLNSVH